jgi:uncharacterized membrane protein
MVKALVEFLKTTLIGGLLIVVPVYLTVLLLGKVLKGMIALLGPIVALFPESLHHFAQIIAIALVVVVCFMLGLIARTGLGRRAIAAFEQRVLERMPGFAMVRSVVRRVSGSSDDAQFQPVLVETDEETLTPGSSSRSSTMTASSCWYRRCLHPPQVPSTSCRASACTGSTYQSPRRSA